MTQASNQQRGADQWISAAQLIKNIKALINLPLPPYIVLAAIFELVEHGPSIMHKFLR
jgi:hypothetical protein